MPIPKNVNDFLTGKKVVCNTDDGREITLIRVWDFLPEDRDAGIFGACAYCDTDEGNEVGVWDDGSIYDEFDKKIATIESDFGLVIPDYELEEWDEE